MLPVDFPSPWKWGGGSKVRTDVLLQYPVLSGIMNEKRSRCQMDKKKIVEQVSELALPICEACGVELVDVEYVRERDWYLRVYIDKEGGIDIDDCTAVSGDLEKVLDEKDVIKEQYYLEVSSPGIDRPLKRTVITSITMEKRLMYPFYAPFEGKKVQTYELVSHDEAHLVVKNFKKQKVTLERSLISSVRPHLDF